MRRTITLTLLTLAALACASLQSANAAVTNLVQTISLKLTAYTEGDATTNGTTVTTPVSKQSRQVKDIIQLLGDATGNTFTSKAKLVLITALDGSDNSSVFVRDGDTDVDVGGFFSYDQGSEHVQASTINTATGTEKGTDYRMIEFSMHDNGGQIISAHFDTTGLSTDKSASIIVGGAVVGDSHQITANLAGHGDFTDSSGTSTLMLQVVLTVVGTTVEIK